MTTDAAADFRLAACGGEDGRDAAGEAFEAGIALERRDQKGLKRKRAAVEKPDWSPLRPNLPAFQICILGRAFSFLEGPLALREASEPRKCKAGHFELFGHRKAQSDPLCNSVAFLTSRKEACCGGTPKKPQRLGPQVRALQGFSFSGSFKA